MTSNPPVMALFSNDLRAAGSTAGSQQVGPGDDGAGFAELLAGALPAELEDAINELSGEELALLEQASLAVAGNDLPPELQDLLQQLPVEGEPGSQDALAVISQWMQMLHRDAPAASGGAPSAAGTETTLAVGGAAAGQPGVLTGDAGMEELEGDLLQRGREPGRELGEAGRINLSDRVQPGGQTLAQQAGQVASPSSAQNGQPDFGALMQRTTGEPSPNAAALFGKLIEQMETGRGRGGEGEGPGAADRAAGITASAAATALTARPVAGAAQPQSVPFGHQSWGESMVERVMWMSSQNLRSVEIQLDPAELGPLEIHIQNRGQEMQVQFVSQNPSVREALEGQMHRLREMFAGQGLEQADVTVADRSAGEQARQQQEQLAGRDDGAGARQGRQGSTGEHEVAAELAQRVTQPRGLVDYYV